MTEKELDIVNANRAFSAGSGGQLMEPTQANGYAEGRPNDRPPHPLDEVVLHVIERLRAETRLYPDVYAWQVTDAVLAADKKGTDANYRVLMQWNRWLAAHDAEVEARGLERLADALLSDEAVEAAAKVLAGDFEPDAGELHETRLMLQAAIDAVTKEASND